MLTPVTTFSFAQCYKPFVVISFSFTSFKLCPNAMRKSPFPPRASALHKTIVPPMLNLRGSSIQTLLLQCWNKSELRTKIFHAGLGSQQMQCAGSAKHSHPWYWESLPGSHMMVYDSVETIGLPKSIRRTSYTMSKGHLYEIHPSRDFSRTVT